MAQLDTRVRPPTSGLGKMERSAGVPAAAAAHAEPAPAASSVPLRSPPLRASRPRVHSLSRRPAILRAIFGEQPLHLVENIRWHILAANFRINGFREFPPLTQLLRVQRRHL